MRCFKDISFTWKKPKDKNTQEIDVEKETIINIY